MWLCVFLQPPCSDQLQDPYSDDTTGTATQQAHGGGGAVPTF